MPDTGVFQLAQAVTKQIASKMSESVKDSANPAAAGQLMNVMTTICQMEASVRHRSYLAEIEGNPALICDYLGELGQSETDVEKHLGREMSPAEREAWEDGGRRRRQEVHAVSLALVRTGFARAEKWMVS